MSDSTEGRDGSDRESEDDSAEDDSAFNDVLREVARAAVRTPPIFLPKGTRLGHYDIVALLGRGGMGVVYRATDTRLGREVALKVLRGSAAGDERRRRFLREARSAAAINHANVATIYEIGEADEHVFLAMELIEGTTLRKRISAGPLKSDEAAHLAREIALGLAPAHAKGIVHRDLKPENVMVSTTGAVKVLDFGLAKLRAVSGRTPDESLAHRETETLEGAVLGTPAYMAPEQAGGGTVDARADVFALGIVLYEMVTGVRPGLLGAGPIIEDERLAEIVRRCIATAPAERFADASELLAALDARLSVPPSSQRGSGIDHVKKNDTGDEGATHQRTPAAFFRSAVSPARRGRVWLTGIGLAIGALTFVMFLVRPRFGALSVAGEGGATPSGAGSKTDEFKGEGPVNLVERRLTFYAADTPVTALAVSNDSQTYAYVDREAVWIASLDGSSRRRLQMPAGEKRLPREIQFFPDGKRILVGSFAPQDLQTWILSLDGAPPARGREAAWFALSPDGTRIAFRQSAENIVIGPVAGGPTTFIDSISREADMQIAWSPDNRRLAIFRLADGDCVVEVTRSDGSSRKTIATDVGCGLGLTAPTWTAANRVAFATTEANGSTAIMEITLDDNDVPDGRPRRVWTGPSALFASLQYRAGRFFFLRVESQRDVYVGRIDARQKLERAPARFTMSDKDETFVGWTPDGRVVYSADRDGQARTFVSSLSDPSSAAMVADTNMVGFAVLDRGDVLGFRAPADGGGGYVSRVTPGGESRDLFAAGDVKLEKGRAFRCARCSSDPVRCVIGDADGGETAYALFDPESGVRAPPFVRLPSLNSWACTLSPDGGTLYLPNNQEGFEGFRVVAVDTGAVRAVSAPGAAAIQFVGSLPGSKDLLISGMQIQGHQYAMARMTAEGPRLEALWASDTLWAWGPIFAPNGRDFAMTARPFHNDVYVLAPADAK